MLSTAQVMERIQDNRDYLKNQFGFNEIYLFGSYASGAASESSDIDLLVTLEKKSKTFANHLRAKQFLKNLLQSDVDLVYSDSINPTIKLDIQEKVVRLG